MNCTLLFKHFIATTLNFIINEKDHNEHELVFLCEKSRSPDENPVNTASGIVECHVESSEYWIVVPVEGIGHAVVANIQQEEKPQEHEFLHLS